MEQQVRQLDLALVQVMEVFLLGNAKNANEMEKARSLKDKHLKDADRELKSAIPKAHGQGFDKLIKHFKNQKEYIQLAENIANKYGEIMASEFDKPEMSHLSDEQHTMVYKEFVSELTELIKKNIRKSING